MLLKKYRLADRQMFRKVLATGSRISGNLFLLAFTNGESLDGPKVGVVVSSKVSKRAVVRNRIKRSVYDAVGKFLEEVSKRRILIFLAKKLAAQATKEEVDRDIRGVMVRFIEK